ncbi:hypothetical protein [Plebeiibacterium sediminum]|uniref:Uncharacterized protein n=1 Tax=Plebeiibacterium sediminum TaxID=2992112 RepID=A0AAE3M9I0_9BACT|nr:hypothetical protein [Plebeiobacterium sediminum]MCW3789387.1 hypothetical protein [Plebeiobacterium sediminum]
MKESYNKEIQLRCITCGNIDFDFNEEKTYIKCTSCNREYLGGYDELVGLNQELIDNEIEDTKKELEKDLTKEMEDMIKKAFKGNKYFKFKG